MTDTPLPEQAAPVPASQPATLTRFSVWQRLEHALLLVSFTTLAVTGLPQKFAATPISQFVIGLFGGIESIRGVHRAAAIVLMALSIYHVVAVLYRVVVRRASLSMFPVIDDFKHFVHDVLFYLGRRKHRAYYGRYSYAEKVEYLAVVWGTLIMALTGFMMWNPIATAQLLPGETIPAAKVAHGGEALLAVLAIILWHFYNVHIRHFNKSIFTGTLSREEMKHEHPAELALIESGQAAKPIPPDALRRRQIIFTPIAAVTVIALGFGLIQFVTFEQTAIDTVPRAETALVFAPFTPAPTPTRPPTATPTATPTPRPTPRPEDDAWDAGIDQLLTARCGECHIDQTLGDLSLATYADVLEGGRSGPAVVPGDTRASPLITIQQKGGHPGQLSRVQLERVFYWVRNGAPETAAVVAPTPVAGASIAWMGDLDQIVAAKCAACHVQATLGDLSLKSYADALKGGKSGAAIVPGDPDASMLVTVQSQGGHPGQLSDEELNTFIEWIITGAPETSGGTAPAPTTVAGDVWTGGIDQLVTAKCAACHVQASLGNLSLKTYADALKGGKSGPAIVPGDPDNSVLVTIQSKGGHPGQLTDDELNRIIEWITSGAPEK